MKLSAFFTLVTAGLLSLTACSNNDAPDNPVDEQEFSYMKVLSNGQESASYKLDTFSCYDWAYDLDTDWVEQNFHDWDGLSVPAPSVLTIHEGRTWKPLTMFTTSYGPSPLKLPLSVYRKVTGFDKDFYVATPIAYDAENKTMNIGSEVFDIEEATPETIKLIHIREYMGGRSGKGGKWKFNMTFKRQELSLPQLDRILFYDSALDANLAIIEMIREQFGDVFNINEYLGGNIILDDPIIIDLNKIEKEIRAYWTF